MRFAHVTNTEEETQLSISLTDDGMFTEHERLSSFFRPLQLGKDKTGHQRLDNDAKHGLHHHDDDSFWAVRCRVTMTVANSVLCLYGEK